MTVMNSRLLLIPALVAATVTFGAPHSALSEPNDAQSHAAALLSGLHAPGKFEAPEHRNASRTPASADAQASAAALLTGRSASGRAKTLVWPNTERTQGDAHAQAAALLSGSRTRGDDAKRDASAAAVSGE
jgi:hypothetical protein